MRHIHTFLVRVILTAAVHRRFIKHIEKCLRMWLVLCSEQATMAILSEEKMIRISQVRRELGCHRGSHDMAYSSIDIQILGSIRMMTNHSKGRILVLARVMVRKGLSKHGADDGKGIPDDEGIAVVVWGGHKTCAYGGGCHASKEGLGALNEGRHLSRDGLGARVEELLEGVHVLGSMEDGGALAVQWVRFPIDLMVFWSGLLHSIELGHARKDWGKMFHQGVIWDHLLYLKGVPVMKSASVA
ncbi:hypothetical protein K503DRAFT_816816 [Rhizopogon vinicolor AM-OR11-026]|uniref:Uncharacterized protein n=1 Tax=Rhizopogon vinicolor AM-OR11-026 TaxID=1314800 RepID=A0A1B7ME87_9AGAM|nr:hypothetical protein K503DRAFT_816816 [Rhizopogon vinicolor AM-OR11-026]